MSPAPQKTSPIGIFDSGIGGMSIWKELDKLLPLEDMIYLADSRHCPYGDKAADEILALALESAKYLIGEGCKMVVVACNTATGIAIDALREAFPSVAFIGAEPAVKTAAARTRSGVIGVVATRGTFCGRHFSETSARCAASQKVIVATPPDWVGIVESGSADAEESYAAVERVIAPMIDAGADQIVLGCTHYPFLAKHISRAARGRAEIIDPAPAIARQAVAQLELRDLLSDSTRPGHRKFVHNSESGNPFGKLALPGNAEIIRL